MRILFTLRDIITITKTKNELKLVAFRKWGQGLFHFTRNLLRLFC